MAGYKFRNRRAKTNVEAMMAPINLIDVVLLLLIFFVTTSTFKKDTGIQIDRPKAKKVAEISKTTKQNILSISKDNEIKFNKEIVDSIAFEGVIKNLMTTQDTTVLILADKGSDVGVLIKLLDTMNIQGFKRYSIAVEKES